MGHSGALLAHKPGENQPGAAAGGILGKPAAPNPLSWSQAMTAFLSPPFQGPAASRSSHAHPEPVGLGPASAAWLKGTFQKSLLRCRNFGLAPSH